MAQMWMNFLFVFSLILFSSFNLNLSKAQSVPAVFVFGDSLVDVGNNNYLPFSVIKADFPHYGLDFATGPTGRFSNGKNAADFLAEKVGLPSPPPYNSISSQNNATAFLKGVSFASGGAGILNTTIEKLGQATSFTQQVDNYGLVYEALVQQLGDSSAQQLISKSIFAFVIGSNDMIHGSDLQKNTTPDQYADLMAQSLKQQMQRLYNNGSRKFVVAGIPPIGCTPINRMNNNTEDCDEVTNEWCAKSNEAVKSMLPGLQLELQDFVYSFFDTNSVMLDMIQNPSNYGFSEVKAACCGIGKLKALIHCIPISTYCSNRSAYLFWDQYHPTESSSGIFADIIFDGPSHYTSPINVRQLISV